jgi:hypothetical protein
LMEAGIEFDKDEIPIQMSVAWRKVARAGSL